MVDLGARRKATGSLRAGVVALLLALTALAVGAFRAWSAARSPWVYYSPGDRPAYRSSAGATLPWWPVAVLLAALGLAEIGRAKASRRVAVVVLAVGVSLSGITWKVMNDKQRRQLGIMSETGETPRYPGAPIPIEPADPP